MDHDFDFSSGCDQSSASQVPCGRQSAQVCSLWEAGRLQGRQVCNTHCVSDFKIDTYWFLRFAVFQEASPCLVWDCGDCRRRRSHWCWLCSGEEQEEEREGSSSSRFYPFLSHLQEELKYFLQENDPGEIQWEQFSLPELKNFLLILDREEAWYKRRCVKKCQLSRTWI